jgi:hypothetical protein
MKRSQVGRLVILSVGALFLCASGFAKADSTSGNGTSSHRMFHMSGPGDPTTGAVNYDRSTATAVFLGGTPIMRFHVAAGGFSAAERADATQQRLNKLLGEGPIYASDITVEPQGEDAVVLVKGQLMFTADSATAEYNTCTPIQLANIWADNLRQVLPGLTAPH